MNLFVWKTMVYSGSGHARTEFQTLFVNLKRLPTEQGVRVTVGYPLGFPFSLPFSIPFFLSIFPLNN